MDLATRASPQPFRSCRTPGYRPFAPAGSVVPPFITTMTCSDFRSALRHLTVQLLIGFAFTDNHVVAQRDPHSDYSGAETDLSCSVMDCATIPPSMVGT